MPSVIDKRWKIAKGEINAENEYCSHFVRQLNDLGDVAARSSINS